MASLRSFCFVLPRVPGPENGLSGARHFLLAQVRNGKGRAFYCSRPQPLLRRLEIGLQEDVGVDHAEKWSTSIWHLTLRASALKCPDEDSTSGARWPESV